MTEDDEIDGRLEAAEPKMRKHTHGARLMYMASIVYAVRMNTQGFIPHAFEDWFDAEFRSTDEDPRLLGDRIVARARIAATQHSQNDGGRRPSPS